MPGGPVPRRRNRSRGDDDTNRWLGTYGDAVTLLMAFFVMLYAMSQIDEVKFTAFVSGLEVPFGNPAIRDGLLADAPAIVGDTAVSFPDVQPPPVEVVAAPEEKPAEEDPAEEDAAEEALEDVMPSTLDLEQLERARDAIDASLAEADLSHVATYRFDERGLVVSIAADDVLFDSGSTKIKAVGHRILTAIAEPLQRLPNDVLVEGHTDNVPLERRGNYTNWNLSTDRAVAVVNFVASDLGIDQRRLGAVGFGEFRPIAPNDTERNRALNRRVDVLVVALGV